jgi:hypothetical protein
VGPTFFRVFSLLCEEIAERVFQTCYLRFCPWFNIWNRNEAMKQQVRWWCKNCKTAIAGYNEMVYINYYQLIQPTFFSRFINPTDMWVLLFINLFKQKFKLMQLNSWNCEHKKRWESVKARRQLAGEGNKAWWLVGNHVKFRQIGWVNLINWFCLKI